MPDKKYFLLTGLFLLMTFSVLAQKKKPTKAADPATTSASSENTTPASDTSKPSGMQWANRDMTYRGKNYDVFDSALYPKFRIKQYKKYLNHQEIFPPKPRNKWEVGAGIGLYNIIGNVPTLMLWQKGGGGFSVNVRKSLGYIFSLRMQYIYGVAKSLDRQPTTGYDAPYSEYGYTPRQYATAAQPAYPIYRAAKMESSQLNLDLMFNAYNINFHNARNKVSFFGYFGLGALGYKTWMNALNGKYQPYAFDSIVGKDTKYSKIRKDLQKKMDKSYESKADNGGGGKILDKKTLDFAPSIGAGVQYKINNKINLQLEERYTFPSDAYLDGSRYGKPLGNTVAPGIKSDAISYFSFSVNYNLKTKKKSVEPLYWINPLDHSYSELSYPRHMILPNPVLPDEDEDGITDQFDKCPHTPKGLAVDAHGCPMDTDGDGVPDYKDKQLITPTECQPVDADGVGHCPCPDGCKDMQDKKICGNIPPGTLLFTEKTNHISVPMEVQLSTLAAQMQGNPNCKVVIMGGGSGSKIKEQHSWEHVNAVIEFMTDKKNISRDRFIFKYGQDGDENIVTYRPANVDETGTTNVPPPHPELK